MMIAADFNGTIAANRYPGVGDEVPFAVETLKLLQQEHHGLILWSICEGKLLGEAAVWCKEGEVEFYAVNKEYLEQKLQDDGFSKKLRADLSIDDRNVGGLLDWGIVCRMIEEHKTYRDIYASEDDVLKRKKRGWFQENAVYAEFTSAIIAAFFLEKMK